MEGPSCFFTLKGKREQIEMKDRWVWSPSGCFFVTSPAQTKAWGTEREIERGNTVQSGGLLLFLWELYIMYAMHEVHPVRNTPNSNPSQTGVCVFVSEHACVCVSVWETTSVRKIMECITQLRCTPLLSSSKETLATNLHDPFYC